MKKCPYCSKAIANDAIYCQYCGRDVRNVSVPISQAPKKKRRGFLASIFYLLVFCCLGSVMVQALREVLRTNLSTRTPRPPITSNTTQPRATSEPDAQNVGATIVFITYSPVPVLEVEATMTPIVTVTNAPTHPSPIPTRTRVPTRTPYVFPTLAPPATLPSNHPAGTSGKCADGTYTSAQHKQGACSHHGGVAQWWGP